MSYCVNCGVELDNEVNKCPLCGTAIINPNLKREISESNLPAFPDRVDLPQSVKHRFTGFIISMVLLIPNIVCFLVNVLFQYDMKWIWLTNATSILIWTILVLPIILNKTFGLFHIIIDAVAISGYAYVIYHVEKGEGWFLECCVPAIIILTVLVGVFTWVYKRFKLSWPKACILFFSEIILASFSMEIILRHYLLKMFSVSISLIITACCASIICFFIAVAKNKKLQMWIDRKFFVD